MTGALACDELVDRAAGALRRLLEAAALVIATLIAVPLGLAIGSNRVGALLSRLVIDFLRPIPSVALIPILVLVSFVIGGTPFTHAVPPILAAALLLSVLVVTVVTVDGRADVVDGVALIGLYVIIAAIFWWG